MPVGKHTTPPVTRQSCPLCGRRGLRRLRRYSQPRLLRCDCGLVFTEQEPSSDELAAHYAQYTVHPLSELTERRYQEWLGFFESFRDRNQILDVGCGSGQFLKVAQAAGWAASGTEYPGHLLDHLRTEGISATRGLSALPDGGFDVITVIEVIEHVADPRDTIEQVVRLLRPGGLAYLTTPNFASLSRRAFGPRWPVIEYPEHLTYWTPGTLRRALSEHGLLPKAIETTGFSVSLAKSALTGKTQTPGRPEDQSFRERIETHQTAKRLINRALTSARLGDALKVYAVKPGA